MDQQQLVEQHLELPRKAAALVYPRVKEHIEFDELVAMARAGLVEAAARYDPSRGAPFGAYAWHRVQGAIFDGLRRETRLPRRVWAKLVALRAAGEYLETQAERQRGAGHPVESTATTLTKVKAAISAIHAMYVVSLEAAADRGLDVPDRGADPDTKLRTSQLSARLCRALEALPERERKLLTKHYWEGKNLLEAGAELGISKSWASRIHAQAVDRLREHLERET